MNTKNLWIAAGIVTGILVVAVIAYFLFAYDTNTSTTFTSNVNNSSSNSNNSNRNTNSNRNGNVNTNANTNVATDDEEETNENSNTNTNTNSNANLNSNANTNSSSTNTNSSVTATGNQTYTNNRYGFTLKYPAEMVYLSDSEELGFYPFGDKDDEDGEPVWFVSVYNKASHELDDLIAAVGENYGDRKESKETVTVNGKSATKVTVTSGTNSTVKAIVIYIEQGGRYFEISNGGTDSAEYTAFYNSFTF